jgi:integrase/recombinase XerD
MKAAVIEDPSQPPKYTDFDDPKAEGDKVIIDVTTAALTPTVKSRAGGKHYASRSGQKFVPGVDGVGYVVEHGKRTDRRVFFLMPEHPFGWLCCQICGRQGRVVEQLPNILLEYLQRHNWRPCRAGSPQEFIGLCPLHQDTRPSFYVNAAKNLFYCHGCGRGGDLIRFVQLFLDLSFRQCVAYLEQQLMPAPACQLLEQTVAFYQLQLHRHPEASHYLEHRGLQDPAVIEELGIGYAPGGNLRRHLSAQGYSLELLLEAGLINNQGRDTFCRRVIFSCQEHDQIVNLYGRSIGTAFPHRLLPRSIVFDEDENQAGQRAAHQLALRLQGAGVTAHIVRLPAGHDPNSYFLAGATMADFPLSRTGAPAMKLFLVHRPTVLASVSPYRLLDEHGQEIAWANAFLDGQCVRQLSLRSLRAYAYDLLHFARWWSERPLPHSLAEITESTLLDYVRHQLDQEPKPTPQTVNHRLCVVHCLYRFHYGHEIPAGQSHFQRAYTKRCPLGYGRPRRAVAWGLRLKQPRRVIVPLMAEEVAKFWAGFRTFRDLAIVGLMLLDGRRSCEVLAVQLEDLQLPHAQMWVLGKGGKKRLLPLPGELIEVLQNYLRLERPLTNSPYLFLSLKGRQRGRPMTAAGLRALFRHHRMSVKFRAPIRIVSDTPSESIWSVTASPCPPCNT